jgi:TPP-dependent 2-oxoacid decarboxylase
MKKIHIQCRTSLLKLATVARGMHKAGLHISRPSDILDIALDAAQKLFSAESFDREEEAEDYLYTAGFHSLADKERRTMLLDLLGKKKNSRDKLEDLIEQTRRGLSITNEIKEMFNETPMSEVREVGSEEVPKVS